MSRSPQDPSDLFDSWQAMKDQTGTVQLRAKVVVEKTPTPEPEADANGPGNTRVLSPGSKPRPESPSQRRQYILKQLTVGSEQFGFRLIQELGRGAFAWVFLAEQTDLAGRLVVLKVSLIEGMEPQTLAQMQHTHIVPIYSFHENPLTGLRGVCMPYFGGATLHSVLEILWKDRKLPSQGKRLADALQSAQSPFPLPEGRGTPGHAPADRFRSEPYLRSAVWIVARLAEALHHAHQHGVIHSDIKPSNILLAADGQPLLLDFNVAQNQKIDPTMSNLGGTLAYTAPEHFQAMATPSPDPGPHIDHRSDLYSLGLVLYKMLTGRNPFLDSNHLSMHALQEQVKERTKPVPSVRIDHPEIPWSLESIVDKCLAPDPGQRYQRADQLAEDLRRYLADDPLHFAPEKSTPERVRKWARRHPRLTISGAIGLAALLLVGIVGAIALGFQQNLGVAQEQLQLAQGREAKQEFEEGAVQALCLINTVTDLPGYTHQGIQVCEATLARYEILQRDDWQEHPAWKRLSAEDRAALGQKARELLLLLAHAKVRSQPDHAETLHASLHLLERAETIAELPPCRALWLDRAAYREKLGDKNGAKEARGKAEAIAPNGAHDHYLLATSYARAGTREHLRKAVAELDQALAINPRHYWANAQRGICLQELGEYSLALGDFSTCVGLWPDFSWGYFNRSYALGRLGFQREAIRDLDQALQREPNFVLALVNRGILLLEIKKYEPALQDLDHAKKLGRDDAFINAGRGMALEGLGRSEEADDAFAQAFAKDGALSAPLRARILWTYGFAVMTRRPDQARSAFDKVLKENPRQPQALFGLARLALDHRETQTALGLLHRAIEADGSFLDARRARALVYARLGNFDSAALEMNWCLDREPRHGVTLYAAACVASLAGEKRDRERMNQQALELLKRAFAENYGQSQAATDPDLAGLHDLPAFRKLVSAK